MFIVAMFGFKQCDQVKVSYLYPKNISHIGAMVYNFPRSICCLLCVIFFVNVMQLQLFLERLSFLKFN